MTNNKRIITMINKFENKGFSIDFIDEDRFIATDLDNTSYLYHKGVEVASGELVWSFDLNSFYSLEKDENGVKCLYYKGTKITSKEDIPLCLNFLFEFGEISV